MLHHDLRGLHDDPETAAIYLRTIFTGLEASLTNDPADKLECALFTLARDIDCLETPRIPSLADEPPTAAQGNTEQPVVILVLSPRASADGSRPWPQRDISRWIDFTSGDDALSVDRERAPSVLSGITYLTTKGLLFSLNESHNQRRLQNQFTTAEQQISELDESHPKYPTLDAQLRNLKRRRPYAEGIQGRAVGKYLTEIDLSIAAAVTALGLSSAATAEDIEEAKRRGASNYGILKTDILIDRQEFNRLTTFGPPSPRQTEERSAE